MRKVHIEGLSGLTIRVCNAKFSIRFNVSAYSIWIQIDGGEYTYYSGDSWFFNEQGMEEAGIWTMHQHAEIYKRNFNFRAIPRVFADFHNADTKGRLRLTCAGTVDDLERQGIVLQEGQSLIIYSEELEVEGVVRYSEEEQLWTAVIDWDAIKEANDTEWQTEK